MLESYIFAVCIFYQTLFALCEDGRHHEIVHVSGWPHDDNKGVDVDHTQLIACTPQAGKKYTTKPQQLLVDLKANICKKIDKAIITKQLITANIQHEELGANEMFVILVVNDKQEIVSESHFLLSTTFTTGTTVAAAYEDEAGNFHFNLSMICEVNYFGESCTKHCYPHDPLMTCNQSGDLVCIDVDVCENLYQVNSCLSNPCLNGGQCITQHIGSSYKCRCSDEHMGSNCAESKLPPCYDDMDCNNFQKEVDWCSYMICGEHGECVGDMDTASCKCNPGFIGPHCNISELKMECTSEFCQCSTRMLETAARNEQDRVKCGLQHSPVHGYCREATCMVGATCSDEFVCHWQSPCQLLTHHHLNDYLPESCSHIELKITRSKLPREMTVTEFCATIKSNYMKGSNKPLVFCDVTSSDINSITIDLFLYSVGGLTTSQMSDFTFIQLLDSNKQLSGILGAVVRAKLHIRGRNMHGGESSSSNEKDVALAWAAGIIITVCVISTLALAVYCHKQSKRVRSYHRFDSLQTVKFTKEKTPTSTEGGNDDEFSSVMLERDGEDDL